MQRHICRFESDQAVSLTGTHQWAGEITDLEMGDDDTAALGHAVGLGGKYRQALCDGGLGQQAGYEENSLAAHSGNEQLLRDHGRTSFSLMALIGQTSRHTPHPLQIMTSTVTFPAVSS